MTSDRATRRTGRLAVLLSLLAVALTGCVSLPESGTVRVDHAREQTAQDTPFDFRPGGPKPGSTPVDIVDGFILAMQAAPLNTFVARQFLTAESSNGWVPEKGTVVFGNQSLATSGKKAAPTVSLDLRDTVQLDGRGEWLGDLSGGKGVRYRLKLVREKGQWRISNPPDELIVPQSHFEARFQQYFLYFFDKSAQVLVPEPVYLPRGAQASTLLVAGLLKGPDQDLLGVERTFIPAKTQYEVSVPISRNGTAEVPLSDEVLDLSDEDLDLALAQLAWTLRQVPGVERMRVTVDGSPLDLPGDGSEPSVDAWTTFDPAVAWASQTLFGLRDDRVVALVGGHEQRVSGPFGSVASGLRSIAVDLPGERVAAVTRNGGNVLVAGLSSGAGADSPGRSRAVYTEGTDLLEPAWDIYDRIWVVDRTSGGARLSVVARGTARTLEAPGITGRDVTAFRVSRDGTRLVAVVHDRSGDRVVVARILRDGSGDVRRVDGATPLPLGAPAHQIRDLAWNAPASVAVLVAPSPGTSQVVVAKVDGSSVLGDTATNVEPLRADAVRIVTAPSPGEALYVSTRSGQLYELASNGRWTGTSIKAGLLSLTFVG